MKALAGAEGLTLKESGFISKTEGSIPGDW